MSKKKKRERKIKERVIKKKKKNMQRFNYMGSINLTVLLKLRIFALAQTCHPYAFCCHDTLIVYTLKLHNQNKITYQTNKNLSTERLHMLRKKKKKERKIKTASSVELIYYRLLMLSFPEPGL
jgi:hypothetical protein